MAAHVLRSVVPIRRARAVVCAAGIHSVVADRQRAWLLALPCRPARSKHCRSCDRCVARFDHHCPWINTCVGAANIGHFISFLCLHVTPHHGRTRSYGARGSLGDRPAVARSTDCAETARRSRALARAGCADSIWRSACVGHVDSQRALGETLGSQARHRPCERPTTTDISTTAQRAAHCGCGHCGMRLPSVIERGSEGGCVRLRRNGCSKAALSSVPPASVRRGYSCILCIGNRTGRTQCRWGQPRAAGT
jgi:hypothetical protein